MVSMGWYVEQQMLPKVYTYGDLIDHYTKTGYYCKKNMRVYSFKNDQVIDQLCFKWYCQRCRKVLKRIMFLHMLSVFEEKQFNSHYIITCEGKQYRDKNDFIQSYRDMNKAWNKLRKLINYWFYVKFKQKGRFTYILLPRAQNDGYCHFHLLTNLNFDKDWLETMINKYPVMGFIKIGKNKKPLDYLTYDFFKDNEYYVPQKIRHYNCSRNIKMGMRQFKEKEQKIVYHINRYKTSWENLEEFNNRVLTKFERNLPFEVWLKYFHTQSF